MTQRFLRLAVSPCLAILSLTSLAQVSKSDFLNPPMSVRPSTYWEWLNGNVTLDGITADMDYMQRAGYGAAMIFTAGCGIPRGPMDYGSREWVEAVRHSMREAEKRGMTLMMHNSPGYSGTGGAWITPDKSMKQLVWADTILSEEGKVKSEEFIGSSPSAVLRPSFIHPFVKQGFYRDAKLLVYPSDEKERVSFRANVEFIEERGRRKEEGEHFQTQTANFKFQSSNFKLTDHNLSTELRLEKGDTLLIALKQAMALNHVTVYRGTREKPLDPHDGPRDYAPTLTVETSMDGKAWESAGRLACPTLRAMDVPGMMAFDEREVRYIRITTSRGTNLAEVDFHYWMPVAANDIVDLSDPAVLKTFLHNKSNWRNKRWTLVRIGYTTTGETVGAAPDAGIGLECDKMSREGLDAHFDRYLTPLLDELRPWCGTTFKGLVIDSWEAGKQDWTERMPEEFQQRRGYDLTPWLLAMTGRTVGDKTATASFQKDFKRTCTDLFLANYVDYFKERLRPYGLLYAGEAYGDGNFESLEFAARQDIPMSEYWTHHIYGNIQTTLLASSAAHVWGKPVVSCECYTGTPFNSKFTEHPYGMKALGDYIMTQGVNHLTYHCTTHQPYTGRQPGNIMTMGPFGTHLDRMSTWADAFHALNLYNSRCCYMLQQGRYVADVLYLKDEGISSGVTNYYISEPQLPYGYRCDVISREALLSQVNANGGRLVTKSGMAYRLLVVTGNDYSPETKARLNELSRAGVPILYSGQGTVREQLDCLHVLPDFAFAPEHRDAQIHFIHRQTANEDIYFVANNRRRKESLTASFRITGKMPRLWDAETGRTDSLVAYEDDGRQTRIRLTLSESGSMFVVFTHPQPLPKGGESVGSKGEKALCAIKEATQTVEHTTPLPTGEGTGERPFAMGCWAKPETFAASGRGLLLYPVKGEGNVAYVGIGLGQNGVRVYERDSRHMSCVLECKEPVSGWTHVAVSYEDGTPRVFLNGRCVGTGKRSAHDVRLMAAPPMAEEQIPASFEGDQTELQVFDHALTQAEIDSLVAAGLPDTQVEGTEWKDLSTDWRISFPAWSKAPTSYAMPRLRSLRLEEDFNVRHFSGTATYTRTFTLSAKDLRRVKGRRVVLDLGRVENIARVSINGSDPILLWKAPYKCDITPLLHKGSNTLTVAVTNLYPNRIIGDEHLPERYDYDEYGRIRQLPSWYLNNETDHRDRVLFLPWKYYTKDDPLLDAGLLGRVRLVVQ